MNFLTFARTSNASQYFDIPWMTPDGKARWKASLIEQLMPKNAMRENTSNQIRHLIGPFHVLVSLLAVLQINMHWLADKKLQVYYLILLSRSVIARIFHWNFTYYIDVLLTKPETHSCFRHRLITTVARVHVFLFIYVSLTPKYWFEFIWAFLDLVANPTINQ